MKTPSAKHPYLIRYNSKVLKGGVIQLKRQMIPLFGFRYWLTCKANWWVLRFNSYWLKHNYSIRLKWKFGSDRYQSYHP